MSLRHPIFHRTILALFWDSQEAGYEHPTLENLDAFREELMQELEKEYCRLLKNAAIKILLRSAMKRSLRSLSVKEGRGESRKNDSVGLLSLTSRCSFCFHKLLLF